MDIQIQHCEDCDDFNIFIDGIQIKKPYKKWKVGDDQHKGITVLWKNISNENSKLKNPGNEPYLDSDGTIKYGKVDDKTSIIF